MALASAAGNPPPPRRNSHAARPLAGTSGERVSLTGVVRVPEVPMTSRASLPAGLWLLALRTWALFIQALGRRG